MIIGYAHVCCDILHSNHIRFLERCKNYCDKLVVGVLSDEAIKEKKAPPILTLQERYDVVKALKCVDEAIIQTEWSPLANCLKTKPDVLFESTSNKEQPANRLMMKQRKRVIVFGYFAGISSTQIKERIIDTHNRKRKT